MKTLFDILLTVGDANELIRNGADVNTMTNNKLTPLHITPNIDIAKILIEHGADINAKDNFGDTVLDKQLYYNKYFFIKNGAIAGSIESYKWLRDLFSQEQQAAFDAFASITNNDDDFFTMCLAYQQSIHSDFKIDNQLVIE
jgi:ankyrin repeat protein